MMRERVEPKVGGRSTRLCVNWRVEGGGINSLMYLHAPYNLFLVSPLLPPTFLFSSSPCLFSSPRLFSLLLLPSSPPSYSSSLLPSLILLPSLFSSLLLFSSLFLFSPPPSFASLLPPHAPSSPATRQLMSAIKTGEVANARMGRIIQQKGKGKISVDRSGGGL